MKLDLAVVGGGLVGLATAWRYLLRHPDERVAVLEQEEHVAQHQSGNNSGVIHSGVYYKPGSLKARTCVAGAAMLRVFCGDHDIPYEDCGKLIVATDVSQRPRLDELMRRGTANGVRGLRILEDVGEIQSIEPAAQGVAALHVPSAGIVSYRQVAVRLADLIKEGGGAVHTRTRVTGIVDDGTIKTADGDLSARHVIGCAGLQSDRLARACGARTDVRIVPVRGEYHELTQSKRHLVRGLVYPVPDPDLPFLGVHFTRRIDGSVEAGPNAVLSLKDLSAKHLAWLGFWRFGMRYAVPGSRELWRSMSLDAFAADLQQLIPDVEAADLEPGGFGVRAQAVDSKGRLVDDFRIVSGPTSVHVVNAPSPAATACLGIAEEILARFDKLRA